MSNKFFLKINPQVTQIDRKHSTSSPFSKEENSIKSNFTKSGFLTIPENFNNNVSTPENNKNLIHYSSIYNKNKIYNKSNNSFLESPKLTTNPSLIYSILSYLFKTDQINQLLSNHDDYIRTDSSNIFCQKNIDVNNCSVNNQSFTSFMKNSFEKKENKTNHDFASSNSNSNSINIQNKSLISNSFLCNNIISGIGNSNLDNYAGNKNDSFSNNFSCGRNFYSKIMENKIPVAKELLSELMTKLEVLFSQFKQNANNEIDQKSQPFREFIDTFKKLITILINLQSYKNESIEVLIFILEFIKIALQYKREANPLKEGIYIFELNRTNIFMNLFYGKINQVLTCENCKHENRKSWEFNHITLKQEKEAIISLFVIPMLASETQRVQDKKLKLKIFKNEKNFENSSKLKYNLKEITSFINQQPFLLTLALKENILMKKINEAVTDSIGLKIQNPNFYFCLNNKLEKIFDNNERIPDYVIKYGRLFLMENPEENIDRYVKSIQKKRIFIYVNFNFNIFYDFDFVQIDKIDSIDINSKENLDAFEPFSFPRVFKYGLTNDLESFIKLLKIILSYLSRYCHIIDDCGRKKKKEKEKLFSDSNSNSNMPNNNNFWRCFIEKIISDKKFLICVKSKLHSNANTYKERYCSNQSDQNCWNNLDKMEIDENFQVLISNLNYSNNSNYNTGNISYKCFICQRVKNYEFYCDCISEFITYAKEIFDCEYMEDSDLVQRLEKFQNKIDEYDVLNNNFTRGNDCSFKASKDRFNNLKRNFFENITGQKNSILENKALFELVILCNYENLRVSEVNKFKDYSSTYKKQSGKEYKINVENLMDDFMDFELVKNEKIFCDNCFIDSQRLKQFQIYDFPKILTINIKNNEKDETNQMNNYIKSIITKKDQEYYIISKSFELKACKNKSTIKVTYELSAVLYNDNDQDNFSTIHINDIFMANKKVEMLGNYIRIVNEKIVYPNKKMILFFKKVECNN